MVAGLMVLTLAAVPAAAVAQSEDINVVIEMTGGNVLLGQTVDMNVLVENRTDSTLSGAAVHIDITDPGQPGSVDPEDWVQTLTQPLADLAPGTAESVSWTLQPIAGGEFSVYAVVLSPGEERLFASQAAIVSVTERRALNPGGMLTVSLAVPIVIAAILSGRTWIRRQN